MICTVHECGQSVGRKGARGMCPRHYAYWRKTGSPTKACTGCGKALVSAARAFCSDECKPRCSVNGCESPVRKRGWCASHYAQSRSTGADPAPFQWRWADKGPCLNCGKTVDRPAHRKFCTDNCRVAFSLYSGPRPTSTTCVACGIAIDLTEVGRKGQRLKTTTRFCRPCKRDYNKYKMSARELAGRDGNTCGICGDPVDMSLSRSDGLMCPSVDHIMPRARGGTHDPENLQLAHLRCNMAKSDRLVG